MHFGTIVMDPPWPETGGGGRGAQNHYPVLRYDEIPAVVLGAPCWLPSRDFWLGIWTTKTSLEEALHLMRACGAQYVTTWTWIKEGAQGQLVHGMGQYGRHGVEYLLWGRRGQPGRNADEAGRWTADFSAPRLEHSEKPPVAYDAARRIFPGPHLEMFAREPRAGWTAWGNDPRVVGVVPISVGEPLP